MKKKEDFCEYGISERSSDVWVVTRGFRLSTQHGPPRDIMPGVRVRLGRRTSGILFRASKIKPLQVPTVYEVIRPFQTVGEDGSWQEASVGDLVGLGEEEGLRLWRGGMVKPKEET